MAASQAQLAAQAGASLEYVENVWQDDNVLSIAPSDSDFEWLLPHPGDSQLIPSEP